MYLYHGTPYPISSTLMPQSNTTATGANGNYVFATSDYKTAIMYSFKVNKPPGQKGRTLSICMFLSSRSRTYPVMFIDDAAAYRDTIFALEPKIIMLEKDPSFKQDKTYSYEWYSENSVNLRHANCISQIDLANNDAQFFSVSPYADSMVLEKAKSIESILNLICNGQISSINHFLGFQESSMIRELNLGYEPIRSNPKSNLSQHQPNI